MAALGVTAYGPVAVATVPALVSVTLPIVSPFTRPVSVKAVGDVDP